MIPVRSGEARFRALVEHASDLIAILDGDGRVRYASPSHQRVLGWAPDQLVGRDLCDLAHEGDADYLRWTLAEVLRADGPVHPRAVRLRNAGGWWCTVDLILTNLVADPAVGGVVVNGRDVTEQETLADQLRQAQKMEALGQLAGGIAHDFNNVLAAIAGFAQLVRAELPADDLRRQDLDEILAATARGSTVTRQLLTFSRRRTVETQELDLAEVVRETGRMLRPLLPASIAMTIETRGAPVWVRADRGQLEQVVMNLAVNARDAMPAGGRLTITVESHAPSGGRRGHAARLVVRDTGSGMTPEVRGHVFEPFFTTKPAGQGTGLGLATVYGIVRQFGGTVAVESAEGAGSTFTIALPLVDSPAEPAALHGAPGVVPRPATILLAEDEESVRRSVERLLARVGHTVLTATDGAAALQLLVERDGQVDLLLTDATMPLLGGRELASRVSARYPGIPIVLMSGYSERLASELGEPAPFVTTLQKPFTAAGLRVAVERGLGAARS
jgi:PAS domain S-box-containing protein